MDGINSFRKIVIILSKLNHWSQFLKLMKFIPLGLNNTKKKKKITWPILVLVFLNIKSYASHIHNVPQFQWFPVSCCICYKLNIINQTVICTNSNIMLTGHPNCNNMLNKLSKDGCISNFQLICIQRSFDYQTIVVAPNAKALMDKITIIRNWHFTNK